MSLVLWVLDLEFSEWGFKFRILEFRVCAFGFGLWCLVFGLKFLSLRLRVWGFGVWIWSVCIEFWSFRFRVWGFWFWNLKFCIWNVGVSDFVFVPLLLMYCV